MRLTNLVVSFVFLTAFLLATGRSFGQTASACSSIKTAAPQSSPMMLARAIKKITADADVQKCITDKLANSKLKDEGITAKVNGGEAVLEGNVKVSAHKGNASQIAKNCGAQKVTNNITITPKPKPSPSPKK